MQQVINILFTVPDFRGDFIVRIQLLPPGTIFIVHQVLNAVVPPCLIPGFILAIAGDGVERVGRQPLRKLSAGDRLIKPLLGTLEYSLPHKNLIQGIAGAMHFRSEDDPQAQELAALIADKGPQAALAQISGLDANSEVVSEAVTAYKAMQ